MSIPTFHDVLVVTIMISIVIMIVIPVTMMIILVIAIIIPVITMIIDHPCHHVDLHETSNPVPLSIRSDHDLRLVWVCSHSCNNSLQSY